MRYSVFLPDLFVNQLLDCLITSTFHLTTHTILIIFFARVTYKFSLLRLQAKRNQLHKRRIYAERNETVVRGLFGRMQLLLL